MADDDDFVRITLRIPNDLHAMLNEAAAKKRSMNAEIIDRLESTFARPSALKGKNFALMDSVLLNDTIQAMETENKIRMQKLMERIESLREDLAAGDRTRKS